MPEASAIARSLPAWAGSWRYFSVLAVLFGLATAVSAQSGGNVYLTEFQAINDTTLADEDGDHSDWVELYNAGSQPVDLGGWRLTDDPSALSKWSFPSPTPLAPGEFLVVFASSKDRAVAGAELHTNFKLSGSGEYLALVKTDGSTVAHEYAPNFPQQYADFSYGLSFDPGITAFESWFSLPTPGLDNPSGGVLLLDVAHAPAVLTAAEDLVVTVWAPGAASAGSSIDLIGRVGYGTESIYAMADDGIGPDAVAGDEVYTAELPAATYAPGEMVRYRVVGADPSGNTGRTPPFHDPLNSPEYYGTMVVDPSVASALPILHWFVEDPAKADQYGGTRASLFYDGLFYDNVAVRTRGGSALYWPKRNYKFDFNSSHHFQWDAAERLVEEVNINSTWSDKSYLRRLLSWETYAAAGSPGCVSFPLRMQQNGQFFSVAVFVEQVDEDCLIRNGLDDDGALYKMFNGMNDAWNGVEKKTREYEDNSDLAAFIAGLKLTGQARADFVMDHVDLPAVVNYLAATTVLHDNDHVNKNYYAYRDTNGDGEWLILPWDKDLTFGRNYTTTGFVLNDTIWADDDPYSHPQFGDRYHQKVDFKWNWWIDAIHEIPATSEMYQRRLRSLMDQHLQAPSTPSVDLLFERRADELEALLDPDVVLDAARWGLPSWGTPLDMAAGIAQLETEYLAVRRTHLYTTHGTSGSGLIPDAQAGSPYIAFGVVVSDPVSGNADEEYLELVNGHATAVDISGWSLGYGIDFTFAPGTVVPAGMTLYVSPDLPTFRARATGPSGGQGLFAVGPYAGHIATGERVDLYDAAGALISTSGAPILRASNLVAGSMATVEVLSATPAAIQVAAWSIYGGGPTPTPYGDAALSPPWQLLAPMQADQTGYASSSVSIPLSAAGVRVWMQAVDLGAGILTNGIVFVVQ